MKSVFIESYLFEKLRSDYLSDDEYRDFQCELLTEPTKGDVSAVVLESFIITSIITIVFIY